MKSFENMKGLIEHMIEVYGECCYDEEILYKGDLCEIGGIGGVGSKYFTLPELPTFFFTVRPMRKRSNVNYDVILLSMHGYAGYFDQTLGVELPISADKDIAEFVNGIYHRQIYWGEE